MFKLISLRLRELEDVEIAKAMAIAAASRSTRHETGHANADRLNAEIGGAKQVSASSESYLGDMAIGENPTLALCATQFDAQFEIAALQDYIVPFLDACHKQGKTPVVELRQFDLLSQEHKQSYINKCKQSIQRILNANGLNISFDVTIKMGRDETKGTDDFSAESSVKLEDFATGFTDLLIASASKLEGSCNLKDYCLSQPNVSMGSASAIKSYSPLTEDPVSAIIKGHMQIPVETASYLSESPGVLRRHATDPQLSKHNRCAALIVLRLKEKAGEKLASFQDGYGAQEVRRVNSSEEPSVAIVSNIPSHTVLGTIELYDAISSRVSSKGTAETPVRVFMVMEDVSASKRSDRDFKYATTASSVLSESGCLGDGKVGQLKVDTLCQPNGLYENQQDVKTKLVYEPKQKVNWFAIQDALGLPKDKSREIKLAFIDRVDWLKEDGYGDLKSMLINSWPACLAFSLESVQIILNFVDAVGLTVANNKEIIDMLTKGFDYISVLKRKMSGTKSSENVIQKRFPSADSNMCKDISDAFLAKPDTWILEQVFRYDGGRLPKFEGADRVAHNKRIIGEVKIAPERESLRRLRGRIEAAEGMVRSEAVKIAELKADVES